MAAVSGILNHQMTAVKPLTNAQPMNSSSTSGGNTGEASNISANDFLTLLVTEMKNQDPTANTDPNQYINQLVQVNSLEQLISINQNLSSALGTSNTGASTPKTIQAGSSAGSFNLNSVVPKGAHTGLTAATGSVTGSSNQRAIVPNTRTPTTSGNLSVPGEKPAAQRVAQALSGLK